MINASTVPVVMGAVSSGTASQSTREEARSAITKREQQIYSPGSGPLRKTERKLSLNCIQSASPSDSSKLNNCNLSPEVPDQKQSIRMYSNASCQNQRQSRGGVNRRLNAHSYVSSRKDAHHFGQGSEQRFLSSNSSLNQTPGLSDANLEPVISEMKKKISLPSLWHLENLPPRLKKKILLEHNLPSDYLEIMRAKQPQQAQIASNRGSTRQSRGRIRHCDVRGGDRGNEISEGGSSGGRSRGKSLSDEGSNEERARGNGRRGYGNGSEDRGDGLCSIANYSRRSMAEGYHRGTGSRSSVDVTDDNYIPRLKLVGCNTKNRIGGTSCSRNSSCERHDRDVGAAVEERHGWADKECVKHVDPMKARLAKHFSASVELPQLPPSRKQSRRSCESNRSLRRNRSNSCSRNSYNDEFKMTCGSDRGPSCSRLNLQSSDVSREYSIDHRDTSEGRFRHHPRDTYQNHSRDTSLDHYQNLINLPEEDSWQGFVEPSKPLDSMDKTIHKLGVMTNQFERSFSIKKAPGVLVLPPKLSTTVLKATTEQNIDSSEVEFTNELKLLFDPKNPSRPIVVDQQQLRPNIKAQHQQKDMERGESIKKEGKDEVKHECYKTVDGPAWYDPDSRKAKLLRQRHLVHRVAEADARLQDLLKGNHLFIELARYVEIRHELQKLLQTFLLQEMRFAQDVNLEHHFWKLLYYNIIEQQRKLLSEASNTQDKEFLQKSALEIVDNGTEYFEQILGLLERVYNFSLEQFVGVNAATNVKGLRYALALVSAQKILLFLGDLARYRELISESNNFRKAKQWYVKAQQILPKNGRPYNQLALLSVYTKRKIDAVYFYMRSLMSSNPFESARESLMDLFNETKKKYESNQRKRDNMLRTRLKIKEPRFDGNVRRETWIHPEGGSRVHRTAPLDPLIGGSARDTSDEEELRGLCSIELNKRFIISFLHVLGKLITKTGMESFTKCAIQMLLEFRALMQYTPIAVTSYRLLQLMSLNMFAIEMTKLKDTSTIPSAGRSEVQECALLAGLLMFDILQDRLLQLVKSAMDSGTVDSNVSDDVVFLKAKLNKLILPEDAKAILPAIKVWCDWMMYHTETWNPPPCCSDYIIRKAGAHDSWSRFAELISMLKNLDTNREILSLEQKEDYEPVRLQEDITLAGFTPLMYNSPEPIFVHRDRDMEEAQNVLRIQKLIFFGTACLCNCDPPVLRFETTPTKCGPFRFVSIVKNQVEVLTNMEIVLESFSDEELDDVMPDKFDEALHDQKKPNGCLEVVPSPELMMKTRLKWSSTSGDLGVVGVVSLLSDGSSSSSSLETRNLLRRKDELERKQRMQEKHNQRLQNILAQSTVALSIEVRPRLLVPDTNCFVDYLPAIELISKASLYQIMVPIIVINELEGLAKGIKQPPNHTASEMIFAKKTLGALHEQTSATTPSKSSLTATPVLDVMGEVGGETLNLQHVVKVAEASKKALLFIKTRNPTVKCVTTKGSILKTSNFTAEDDDGEFKSNDDRILMTALNLCRNYAENTQDGTRFLTRDVVLLTTDRNLRVKALSNDLPVRELPDFIKWAGLGA